MSSEVAAYTQPSVWAYTVKLLRLRLRISLSGILRAKRSRQILWLVLIGLLLAGAGFVFYLSLKLLNFLRSAEISQFLGSLLVLLEKLPSLVLGGSFLIIFLTSFGVLLQTLYLARDMDFLLAAPIPIRAVFLTKLLQAILPNLALIALFALPVLFGLGLLQGYSYLYYPMVLLVLAAFALAAAGLASLLVMMVVRVFPARRVAELLGFLGAIFSILCSQSGQLARFQDVGPDQAMQYFNTVSRVDVSWSPFGWAGTGLVDIGKSQWLPGMAYLAVVLGLAGAFFFVSLVTAERWYYTGWASLQNKRRKRKAVSAAPERAGARHFWESFSRQLGPSSVRAIILKDFKVLSRDLRNMSQLVTPLVLGLVYAVMVVRGDRGGPPLTGREPAVIGTMMANLAVYLNIAIALFVGWMLLGRLGGMGFSQEGKSYWMVKAAPITSGQLLASKFLVAYLPSVVLGWGFLLLISLLHPASQSILWFAIPLVALSIASNAGINLAFGVVGVRLDWEDPRQMVRGGTGCISALVTLICMPISLVLFFGPIVLAILFGWPTTVGQLLGLLLGGAFCLVLAIVPLWMVYGRVAAIGEG